MAKESATRGIAAMRARTHEQVDSIMDKAESVSQNGKARLDRLSQRAAVLNGGTDAYIRKHPKASVLFAAGVGALAGAILIGTMLRQKG